MLKNTSKKKTKETVKDELLNSLMKKKQNGRARTGRNGKHYS